MPVALHDTIPGGKFRDHFLRFVRTKHAKRYRYGQVPPLTRSILAHTLLTQDRKVAFIKNPKAGCTTVSHLLYQYDVGERLDGDIHEARAGISGDISHWEEVLNALQTAFSFSTVRHPERRAVSAFYDFFVEEGNPQAPKHFPFIEEMGFSKKADLSYRFDVFLNYIEASIAYSKITTDRHFRPQYINLGADIFDLSYIACVETLAKDLREVSDLTAYSGASGIRNLTVTLPDIQTMSGKQMNRTASSSFKPNRQQKAKIEDIYARDYELYGY